MENIKSELWIYLDFYEIVLSRNDCETTPSAMQLTYAVNQCHLALFSAVRKASRPVSLYGGIVFQIHYANLVAHFNVLCHNLLILYFIRSFSMMQRYGIFLKPTNISTSFNKIFIPAEYDVGEDSAIPISMRLSRT